MNLFNIIQDLEQVDPEFHEKLNPRRAAIKNITSFGSKVTLAALPFALGTMFKRAEAATTTEAIAVLNFALLLEHLEAKFYTEATSTARIALIPVGTPAVAAIRKIRDDENAHVAFLTNAITAAGGTPINRTFSNFDYTAGGTFNDVFTNYDTFLAVAQAFEDTGVRAYKGQAPALKGERIYLTAALNIHSVEARHASHIRQMRRARGGAAANMKPYITGANDSGVNIAAVDKVYAGEDKTIQAGVTITNLNGVGGKISTAAATESFDEFLTKAQVEAVVAPFIRP